MGKQICFYEKNLLDFDNENASVSASLGDEFSKFVRSRLLTSAWLTTDSVDADQPYLEIDLGDPYEIDTIFLVDQNFKHLTVELYDFDTGYYSEIATVSDNQKETLELSFAEFIGQKFRITVHGTITADEDKRLGRLIFTKKIGQFQFWPKIKSPTLDRNRVVREALSGKSNVLKNVGAFKCTLAMDHWRNAADLALVEKLFRQVEGFEVWFAAGNESQFYFPAEGFREKDIFLMSLANEYKPEFYRNIYTNGLALELQLVEVVR